jgi:hypothetical protein
MIQIRRLSKVKDKTIINNDTDLFDDIPITIQVTPKIKITYCRNCKHATLFKPHQWYRTNKVYCEITKKEYAKQIEFCSSYEEKEKREIEREMEKR